MCLRLSLILLLKLSKYVANEDKIYEVFLIDLHGINRQMMYLNHIFSMV